MGAKRHVAVRLVLDSNAADDICGALNAPITLVNLGWVAKVVDEDHGFRALAAEIVTNRRALPENRWSPASRV